MTWVSGTLVAAVDSSHTISGTIIRIITFYVQLFGSYHAYQVQLFGAYHIRYTYSNHNILGTIIWIIPYQVQLFGSYHIRYTYSDHTMSCTVIRPIPYQVQLLGP